MRLAEVDEDVMMAVAAVVDLLRERNLTDYQFEKVCDALSLFGQSEKFILREISFRKFKRTLRNEEGLTEEIFSEFFNEGNADIHRVLIWHADKTQMELIAEKGASKAVRNIAKQELNSRKFR